jgi:hypothetical protein
VSDCCAQSQNAIGESDTCCSVSPPPDATSTCPSCGTSGRHIDRITLKSLLSGEALMQLTDGEYRFCPTKECDVVYFAPKSTFRKKDIAVPVWQKSDDPSVPVCYCFGHSEESIRAEMIMAGRSTVLEDVKRLVREGRCACEVRNPQGACCLGNVAQVVTRLRSTQPATKEKS